ncbi:MAG TPA: alpha/beta fold hydrolase [Gemmatimonadales bacterium]|nr:alpha/beta fold hydrolase [Gemmatimonadales bacterium]
MRRAVALAALLLPAALVAQAPTDTSFADSLAVPGGILRGTLATPTTPGPWPAVLFISGSGPTDRDGNSPLLAGRNNSLRYLADALAARGIASVRYDKRGIAASNGFALREADLRFDDYVGDAATWIRALKADRRFRSVTVVGHSEGSLVGMLAAAEAGADAFVSIAGAGRPIAQILHEQLAPQLPPDLLRQADSIMARLGTGERVDSVPPRLWMLYRQSVQGYLISWMRHDPARDLAALKVPVLIAQGTTDIQVDTLDARLLAAADPAARLLLIPGMNHVLKMVPADRAAQVASYSDPALPVAPALVYGIATLVLGLGRAR